MPIVLSVRLAFVYFVYRFMFVKNQLSIQNTFMFVTIQLTIVPLSDRKMCINHARAHTHTDTHTHTLYVYVYLHMCNHTQTHTHTHTQTYIYIHTNNALTAGLNSSIPHAYCL